MSKTSASFTSKWVMFIHFPQKVSTRSTRLMSNSAWVHNSCRLEATIYMIEGWKSSYWADQNNVDVCQLSMIFSWCQTDQTAFVWVGNMMTLASVSSVSEDSETHREFGGVIFKLLTHHEFNLLCSGLRQWVTSSSSLTTSSLCSRWGAICVEQITTRQPKGRQITRRPDIGNLLVWFTM